MLVVAGTATLERAGQQSALQAGTLVESGDVLAVGDQSALQVRFTDESIVSFRANSQFRIDDYRFDHNTASDRSLMGLFRGGMRTISGLIGKANQKNYTIRAATSTIGMGVQGVYPVAPGVSLYGGSQLSGRFHRKVSSDVFNQSQLGLQGGASVLTGRNLYRMGAISPIFYWAANPI